MMSRSLPLLATWLLVLLLPVLSTSSLIDGIWRPAHYHLHHPHRLPVVIDDGIRVMHPDDIVGYVDPEVRPSKDGLPVTDMAAAEQHLAIGLHHHGIGDTEVVYVAVYDGDPSTPVGGKRGMDGEWTLPPGCTIALDARRVDAGFGQINSLYLSHRSSPPSPPPRA